jgi:hypothetical protein
LIGWRYMDRGFVAEFLEASWRILPIGVAAF